MNAYNDIGINNMPDWKRIRKLLLIGVLAGCQSVI